MNLIVRRLIVFNARRCLLFIHLEGMLYQPRLWSVFASLHVLFLLLNHAKATVYSECVFMFPYARFSISLPTMIMTSDFEHPHIHFSLWLIFMACHLYRFVYVVYSVVKLHHIFMIYCLYLVSF